MGRIELPEVGGVRLTALLTMRAREGMLKKTVHSAADYSALTIGALIRNGGLGFEVEPLSLEHQRGAVTTN